MRILFLSDAGMPDYQCDMLFHGLRELLGPEVVDVSRLWYLYAADFRQGLKNRSDLYGRGFSLYGLLGDDQDVDRTDIASRIRHHDFDFVIYGSVRRAQPFLDEVLAIYPAERIVFVDGEDDPMIVAPLLGRGRYFKRELNSESRFVDPIQFAIPTRQIGRVPAEKTRVQAFIDPRDRRTYIYDTEEDYYGDYAQSLFGYTQKKAGWDCLRHYEIMANQCVPNFEGLEHCPPMTMVFLPKYELITARNALLTAGEAYFSSPAGMLLWQRVQTSVQSVLERHLTTIALARYLLDTIRTPDAAAPMLPISREL